MSKYKDLTVWEVSYKLTLSVYRLTNKFPREEIYGLTSQIRRASVSIPSNIAEGSKRGSKKDFCHFLVIAQGSGAELETQLLLSKDLDYITITEYNELIFLLDSVMKMLTVFIKKLSTINQ